MHNQLPKTALPRRDGWSSQAQNEQVEILNSFDSLTSMFRFSTNYKVGGESQGGGYRRQGKYLTGQASG